MVPAAVQAELTEGVCHSSTLSAGLAVVEKANFINLNILLHFLEQLSVCVSVSGPNDGYGDGISTEMIKSESMLYLTEKPWN